MPKNLRVALGAAAAVCALVVSSATAQASTTQAAKATGSARPAAATFAFPTGVVRLSTAYGVSWCLSANGYGRQVTLGDDCAGPGWTMTMLTGIDSRGGAWVTLHDQTYGYCLDAEDDANGSPNINGDHVNSWPCDGAAQQRWYLWPLGGGTWMIVSGFNTNKVLDARTSGSWNPTVKGDPVQVWDHVGTAQQEWYIG